MIQLTERHGFARVGHARVADFVVISEFRLDVRPRIQSGAGFRLFFRLRLDEAAVRDAVAAVASIQVLLRFRRGEQVVG